MKNYTRKYAICLIVILSCVSFKTNAKELSKDFEVVNYQQTNTISGYVTDANGSPVGGADVSIEGTTKGASTDTDGHFTISGIPQGSYMVTVAHVGMETQKQRITLTIAEKVSKNFTLIQKNEQLDEVVIQTRLNKFNQKSTDQVARLPLKNLENPQVYSIIPAELLNEQITVDIQGALQNAPGVSNVVEGVGSGGVGLSLRLRGFDTGIALRNGMATNYVTLSDPVNLERIEVIKGPSATLFGSTLISYGGLVNRITKKPYEVFGGEVGYSAGSNGLSRLTADINTPLNAKKTLLLRVNAAKHAEKSFQNYGNQNNYAVSPNLVYKVSDRLTLNLETEIFHTTRPSNFFGISPGVTATSFDDLDYDFKYSYSSDELQSKADVFNVFAKATYQLSDRWKSETNFSTGNTDNVANYLFLNFLDNSEVRRMPMHITSNFTTAQIQQNFIGSFETGAIKHRVLVGADYFHLTTNDRRTRFVYDTITSEDPEKDFNFNEYQNTLGETAPFFKYVREQETLSAYVSEVATLAPGLNVMASLRVDHFNNKTDDFQQTAFSPKLGVTYEPIKDEVSVFANYMDGFQNVAPGESDTANPIQFEPEHATQYEGGIKTNLWSDKLSFTASVYDITVRNIVRTVANADNIGGFNSVQDGTRKSKGLELELVATPAKGWNIFAGYGYNHSEYTKAAEDVEGNRPYSTPYNSANLWTSYKFSGALRGLGLGFGGNYVGESYFNDANTFKLPSYTVVNATIFYDKTSYRIGLKLNNLGDEEYWTASYWAQPQKTRNFIVNFTYKF